MKTFLLLTALVVFMPQLAFGGVDEATEACNTNFGTCSEDCRMRDLGGVMPDDCYDRCWADRFSCYCEVARQYPNEPGMADVTNACTTCASCYDMQTGESDPQCYLQCVAEEISKRLKLKLPWLEKVDPIHE